MATIKRFEEIEAWRSARTLAGRVYRLSSTSAFWQDFALRDQIRAAAISAMSNIAEGFEREGRREFRRFLVIAKASAGEVESQAYLAADLGYLDPASLGELRALAAQTKRLIVCLIRYLDSKRAPA